jgi:hypothetical protein
MRITSELQAHRKARLDARHGVLCPSCYQDFFPGKTNAWNILASSRENSEQLKEQLNFSLMVYLARFHKDTDPGDSSVWPVGSAQDQPWQ